MKYVCLTHFYIEHNGGGGELMLHALLRELAKRHEVTVLITDTQSADVNIDGVNVRYTRDRTADLLSTNPDVIMAQFYNAEHAFELSRSHGVPFVMIVHNNMNWVRKIAQVCGPNDLLVFNSKWLQRDVSHSL